MFHSILAATEENQTVRVCAEHLRQYSEGLNLSNTIRMCDAFSFLNKYHVEEIKRKTTPDEEQVIQVTPTERFLFNLFKGIVVLGKHLAWLCPGFTVGEGLRVGLFLVPEQQTRYSMSIRSARRWISPFF